MDAYEATRIVFSRIQNLDPENAAKIMGLLLIQEHGEKEMIRLAFGPEALLHSLVLKVRRDLGLLPSSSPATPSGGGTAAGVFSRQNSARFFSISPPEELVDELQLQDQFSFLSEGGNNPQVTAKCGGLFLPDMVGDCPSPGAGGEGVLLSNSVGWGLNGTSFRRSCGAIGDFSSSSDLSNGFGWRPCLYFARGFCKNGNACRFLHDDAAAEQELLLRSRSSKLMASATPFPCSPTACFPASPSSASVKYLNVVFQHQNDGQRAPATSLMLTGGDEVHKFMCRARPDFTGISNPGSRQIYLTFPADSTFREEDVSNYFSIYGPVQDVRIPFQQKRMFGFVTFVYPETVKLILAKGNPHFVCDARVLVKPYKEKGKVPDKKQQQADRLDLSCCWTSTGLDSPLDIGGRKFYNIGSGNVAAQDASLLRRRLEEEQQAELLQQAIELQGKRFQLLDLKPRSFSAAVSATTSDAQSTSSTTALAERAFSSSIRISRPIATQENDMSSSTGCSSAMQQQQQQPLNNNAGNKVESAEEPSPKDNMNFPVCIEHNLPDSPFASPTKASSFSTDLSFSATSGVGGGGGGGNPTGTSLLLPSPPLSPYCFQIPARFTSDHGAIGM
ncbi:zinc finger CCCH domain-containing protein 53-like isoform X2 [Phalaenopsis equestris]|uniref:zinc finger CCCH domain-containing protein 53-like isoform X2 n=1 Tax=Phalaenopsis equestris TaxID=78828 RepID=UPI0009E559B1|nr:zinc finger CCCH domain-containing protein 53-like isoform X2 [Phalaenopsis equestris]